MYDAVSLTWLIIAGLLEPIWLFALKKSENFKNIPYSILAIVFMFLSPICMSFAMKNIPVGIAYSIWTGIGAACAVGVGFLFLKDKITRRMVGYIVLIVIGTIGLGITGGQV